jgi:hypothetical protein
LIRKNMIYSSEAEGCHISAGTSLSVLKLLVYQALSY